MLGLRSSKPKKVGNRLNKLTPAPNIHIVRNFLGASPFENLASIRTTTSILDLILYIGGNNEVCIKQNLSSSFCHFFFLDDFG